MARYDSQDWQLINSQVNDANFSTTEMITSFTGINNIPIASILYWTPQIKRYGEITKVKKDRKRKYYGLNGTSTRNYLETKFNMSEDNYF